MTVLDSLTLDITFEKRYELKGHQIVYQSMHRDGSVLRCTVCGRSVELRVNDLGGWWTSNRDLDKECEDQLPPGGWVPNDFEVGDRITVETMGACTVTAKDRRDYYNFELTVEWDEGEWHDRVWPNLQWIGLLPAIEKSNHE